MDAGIEKECSALGGLFQLIMNDMKVQNHFFYFASYQRARNGLFLVYFLPLQLHFFKM